MNNNRETGRAELHKTIWRIANDQEAESLLKRWLKKTSRSTIGLVQKMAKTVMDHWNGILSYFDSTLTTGFLEGINSLIQSAKARARGYRNPRNMIAMAYLIAGKLRFNKLYAQPT